MKIFINGTELDFQLGDETVLLDIMQALDDYVLANKHVITEVRVNSLLTQLHDAFLSYTPLDQIDELDLKTESFTPYIEQTVTTLRNKIETLLHWPEKNPEEIVENIEILFLDMESVLAEYEFLMKVLQIDAYWLVVGARSIQEIVLEYKEFLQKAEQYEADIPQLMQYLQNQGMPLWRILSLSIDYQIAIFNFFETTKNDDQVAQAIYDILPVLKEMHAYIQDLVVIVEHFNKGKDQMAIDTLYKGISVYYFFVKIYQTLDNMGIALPAEMQEMYSTLMSTVEDITDNLEKEDMIQVSDIVEFEYIEKMDQLLVQILQLLESMIQVEENRS